MNRRTMRQGCRDAGVNEPSPSVEHQSQQLIADTNAGNALYHGDAITAAGFTDVEITPVPSVYHAPASEGFWEEFLQFSVRTPIIMDRQTDETRAAIEADVAEAISDYESAGELSIPMPSFVVSAVRPAC